MRNRKHLGHGILFGTLGSVLVAGLIAPPLSNAQEHDDPNGPVAHWAAEGDGTDSAGGGNDATLFNGASFAPGRVGLAFDIDGVDDFVEVNNQVLGNGAAALSVEAWINLRSFPAHTDKYVVVGADDGGSFQDPSLFNLFINRQDSVQWMPQSMVGVNVAFGVRTSTQPEGHASLGFSDASYYSSYWWGVAIATSPQEFVLGEWVHLVGVYDGLETRLYINGTLAGTSSLQPDGGNRSVSGPLVNTTLRRRIGRPHYDLQNIWTFDGLIDEVKIYDRSLTASEITDHYLHPGLADVEPPVVSTPGVVDAEATDGSGALVTFDVLAQDGVDGALAATCSPATGALFPIGTTAVECSATDAAGNTGTATFSVFVADTTPPTIRTATPSVSSLWPANSKMVDVSVSVTAEDAVASPTCSISGVRSNEPIVGDWSVTGALELQLRASRLGNGTGRTYAVTIACWDGSNTASTDVLIAVPHDRRGGR